jgi:hypothetical protein
VEDKAAAQAAQEPVDKLACELIVVTGGQSLVLYTALVDEEGAMATTRHTTAETTPEMVGLVVETHSAAAGAVLAAPAL